MKSVVDLLKGRFRVAVRRSTKAAAGESLQIDQSRAERETDSPVIDSHQSPANADNTIAAANAPGRAITTDTEPGLDNVAVEVVEELRPAIADADIDEVLEPFDPAFYAETYPDVRASGMDPYVHYVAHGKAEGRLAVPPRHGSYIAAEKVRRDDFDEAFYREMNGDVAMSGVDLYDHFVNYGRAEGRLATPPIPEIRWNASREISGDRATVLVVSHEASRSGAPILAWNICRELRSRFNVIGLVLGAGPLVDDFAHECDGMIGPLPPASRHPVVMRYFIRRLCKDLSLKFAIVNSIESRFVLQPLAEMFCPTVFLIHEYYAYSKPHNEFDAALQWATRTVFSAKVVQANALNGVTQDAIAQTLIIPQGKSVIPDGETNKSPDAGSIDDFFRALNISRDKARPFLVLGAGTVHFRKGVDLFIATAEEVQRRAPDADIRFVWIGHDLKLDPNYTACIEQQIQNAGPDSPVVILDEVPYLEEVYRQVDLFFLPSRMDPLPNVSIDAMTVGLPVICYEGGTGIAEILARDPLTRECVVSFSNVSDAAGKVLEIYRDDALHDQLSLRVQKLAQEYFDMGAYVARLVELAEEAADITAQERADCYTLSSSSDFDERYFVSPVAHVGQSREDAIRGFVRSSVSRIVNYRKPVPGFDSCRYREDHDLCDLPINDFAHYLRAGRPAGPWLGDVIDFSSDDSIKRAVAPPTLKCAVHIHAHYPDLLGGIVERLLGNALAFDLYVSVPNDEVGGEVLEQLATFDRGSVVVHVVPNRGRDIGPMLTEFAEDFLAYDLLGHLHTKKSVHVPNPAFVKAWVDFLMENLAGGQYKTADIIASHFADDPLLGLVYADDPHAVSWGLNWPYAQQLARKLGLETLPRTLLSFPVGTMFWARPAAIKSLFDIHFDWSDYPKEPLAIDGSMLHAIERLLPSVVMHEGYRCASTYIPGLSR